MPLPVTAIKICGITSHADALMATDAGAHALGINLIPTVRRYAGPHLEWLRELPATVSRIALVEDLAALTPEQAAYFDGVQFYADTTGGKNVPTHLRLMPVVRLKGAESLADVAATDPKVDSLVLDAYHPKALGGTGQVCDWDLAARAVACSPVPVLLAGGLTPENVADAIVRVRPFGVDVSSGVEAEIRHKDPAKVRAFIAAVRAAGSW